MNNNGNGNVNNNGNINQNQSKQRSILTIENIEERLHSSRQHEEDPKITLNSLPPYFLGGIEIAGFGRILGHALALLYVARHGLKESELWAILASLPKINNDSIPGSDINKSKHKQPVTDEMKALISVCAHYREKFRTTWQSNDLLHTHRLSTKKLLVGMQSVNPEFSKNDLDLLLTILDCKPREVNYFLIYHN